MWTILTYLTVLYNFMIIVMYVTESHVGLGQLCPYLIVGMIDRCGHSLAVLSIYKQRALILILILIICVT